MAVSSPNSDKPANLSGGADAWDDGLAGILLLQDFIQPMSSDTVYLGPDWGPRYAGSKPVSQLYLGVKTLHL